MPQGPGYLALPTIDSIGSSDSPGGDKDQPPRVAPALPPRSGSSSSGISENDSLGRSSAATAAAPAGAGAIAAGAAPAGVQRTTSAPSPTSAAAGVGAGRGVPAASSSARSSSGGSAGGGGPVLGGPGSSRRAESWMGAMDVGSGGVSDGEGGGTPGGDGLFHDAQDVPMPTLSVYDPERLWEYVERPLMVYMPLRKLSAKPPAVSTPTNIDELPVRCLVHRTLAGTEVAARLVDTPAERYRASFAFIYMVSAESQEHYKQTVRPLIRAWVDKVEARGAGEDAPGWLLLYVIVAPQGGGSSDAAAATAAAVDAQGKIFWWLCADFYAKTPGDRCSLVSLYVDGPAPARGGDPKGSRSLGRSRPSASPRHHPKQWSDLLAKVGRVVMEVFEARVRCYANELAHLDATRGMIGWDFGKFFVVKESLALMYKELQLPSEALLKYQELAALILTMGEGSEASLRSPTPSRSPVLSPVTPTKDVSEDPPKDPSPAKDGSGAKQLLFGLAVAGQKERPPASVLDYGQMRFRERVNGGRLHSLVLETQLYIFARQCALNLELKKPAEVARMGGRFMPAYYHELIGQAADLQDAAGGWGGDFDDGTTDSVKPSPAALDPAEVELFALKSSWDVVKACDRYFARALNPGGGLEPPPREMNVIRQARVETSRFLAELLEFAQTRLLEYARLVAERGREREEEEEDDDDDDFGDEAGGLMGSCVWELQERGFLASQRDWIPQNETAKGVQAAAAAAEAKDASEGNYLSRTGRMRVEGSLLEVKAVSGQYFWDRDEEGEVFIPPSDDGVKRLNPIKLITGGDGVPSPQKSRHSSHRITDFDDDEDESDETDNSVGSEASASRSGVNNNNSTTAAGAAASAAAAQTALSKVGASSASLSSSVSATNGSNAAAAAAAAASASGSGGGDAGLWLLDKPEALEDAYLQLTHSLGQHNQRAGRVRAAARCWGRRTELLLERGEVGVAQARLSALADLYQAEGWLPQAFWALHRLARCRRSLALFSTDESGRTEGGSDRREYVSTVMRLAAVLKDPRVRSEGGKAAVENAAAALLHDARSLATPPEGSTGRDASPPSPERSRKAASASAPAAGPHVFVDPTGDGRSKHLYRLQCFADVNLAVTDADAAGGGGTKAGASGKGKKSRRRPDPFPAVHIGDPLYVSCVLTSHLPEAVTLDALVLEMAVGGGGSGGGGSGGSVSGVWNVQPPAEASSGGRHSGGGEQPTHRRSSPKRSKSLRRLESVKTVGGGGDNDPSPAGSPVPAGTKKFKPPPPVATSSGALGAASQALVTSGAGSETGAEPAAAVTAAGTSSGFQVPPIRTTRSQSLSPRISATSSSAVDVKDSLVMVPSSKTKSSKPPRGSSSGGGGGGGGRGRSPPRHSIGASPTTSPFHSAPGGGSRMPKARARPACTGRIEGPVELLPGDTEVIFTLRPTVAGVLTASRISVTWGGVTLIEALSGGGRGRGASGVLLPSAWVGVPRPPPSAVVRPFLPRAVLEVLPPNFLPLGNEGWLRVTVTAGPDTLRGARVRVVSGRGLAWGAAEASRVTWRHSSDGTEGIEQPAQARAGEDSADMLVDLQEVLRPGSVAEVSVRVRSTAEAAAAGTIRAAVAPRSCVVKAELLAWHSRHAAGDDVASATGDVDNNLNTSEDWGVECRTFSRAGISPRLPFEARVTVTERQAGVVLSQAALVCTAPVALSLRSCELSRLEPGAEVLSDPNAFLGGEVLPPGQPLRLAACLRRPSAAESAATAASTALAAMSVGGSAKPTDAGGVPLAVHRLRYSIEPAAGGAGGECNPAELFVFDVCIPNPGSGARGNTSPGSLRAAGAAGAQRSLVTTVRPCDGNSVGPGDGGAGDVEDDVLHLKLAEPRAFEFGVADGGDAPDDGIGGQGLQSVTYQVVASPSDWMMSGLIRGIAKLELKDGRQSLCRVHLVPIRCGLLALPRLDVSAEGRSAGQGGVEVWTPDLRKVLVLPPGDAASVCQARAP
eukprot:g1273.t1